MAGPDTLQGKTSAEIRQKYIDLHFVPLCRRAFEADPDVQSLILTVGQYWCDEAEDAVHLRAFPSGEAKPAPGSPEHPRGMASGDAKTGWPGCLEDARWMVEGEPSFGEMNARGAKLVGWKASRDLPHLDDNSTAITAFASYCVPGCDQEMPPAESQTPYAIGWRGRTPSDVQVDIVGHMHQPQWEDRFDVGGRDD